MAIDPDEHQQSAPGRRLPPLDGRSLAWVIGAIVLIGMLVGAEFNHHLIQRELRARAHVDALGFASTLRAGLERELNADLYLSSGLASYLSVRHTSLDPAEIEAILAHLFEESRHVRNLGIAIGYRLTWVYPRAGNEAAIGLNYPDHPDQWLAVRRAIQSGHGTLAGPVRLAQGGEGLVYRQPLWIEGRYWGLLSTVIDSPSLLAGAVRDFDAAYAYAIRGRDGLGAEGDVFAGDAGLFQDENAVTLAMAVPNGSWLLAVKPRASPAGGRYAAILRALGWTLALLLALAATTVLRHRFELSRLALIDPLTALPNRRYLEQSLDRVPDGSPQRRAVLFIDLDGFKEINDRHGHRAGDAILKRVGERVSGLIRQRDMVARWGGDELVVVMEEASLQDLAGLADRLRAAVAQPVPYDGRSLQVGASIGYALSPADGTSLRELLKVADQRMYEEKHRRKLAPA